MIIRWVLELRLGFKADLNLLRVGTRGQSVAVAVMLSSLSASVLAQIMPGTGASQSTTTSPRSAAASAPAFGGGASAPAGYVLGPNDQVSVEVFGEEDLRANGRLNPEGNISVPL